MSTTRLRRANVGFTLAELAIVLVIVALLVGGMLVPLSAQRDVQNTLETQRQLAEIREALLGFAVINGRLPRPATSHADGAENPVPCASEAACTGFVPWTALGVRKTDAWNKMIVYSVTRAYANALITFPSTGNRTVQTRDNAGTLSYLIGGSACSNVSPCAAAVLYSAGRDNWGSREDGVALPDESATNVDEDANAAAATNPASSFIARNPGRVAGGGEFDDIVVWLSPNILCSRLLAAGRLP